MRFGKFVQTLCASAFCCALLAGNLSAAELTHWPKEAREKLEAMIEANANKGQFATFDPFLRLMVNTGHQLFLFVL